MPLSRWPLLLIFLWGFVYFLLGNEEGFLYLFFPLAILGDSTSYWSWEAVTLDFLNTNGQEN